MPARFLTDASLEFLARRLRQLGFDAVTLRGARLEELCAAARQDARTVLTLSARHPRKFADVPVMRVASADPAVALRAIADSHEPAGPPFSRCPRCNAALQRRLAFEAGSEVPPRVRRGATHLSYCANCAQWYWDGTHVTRLREWFAAVLGREIARAPRESEGD